MPARAGMAPASRLLRRKENTTITLYDHIKQLRAELRGCYFIRRERAAVKAELAKAIAEQAQRDHAFDAALEALSNSAEAIGAGAAARAAPSLLCSQTGHRWPSDRAAKHAR
jgi:hypothetical protein